MRRCAVLWRKACIPGRRSCGIDGRHLIPHHNSRRYVFLQSAAAAPGTLPDDGFVVGVAQLNFSAFSHGFCPVQRMFASGACILRLIGAAVVARRK